MVDFDKRISLLSECDTKLVDAERAYEHARSIAASADADGVVFRINIHLRKLEVLRGQILHTKERLQRRKEISNGN